MYGSYFWFQEHCRCLGFSCCLATLRVVEISETFEAVDRAEWRAWLEANGSAKREIWLVSPKKNKPFTYVESVLEALCFGWIDGIAKSVDAEKTAQRFTPRRPKGNWTELNKERCRNLIAAGLMTPAGLAVMPDLTIVDLVVAADIQLALNVEPDAWANSEAFPDLYKRIRIDYIEEMRKQPAEFEKRLGNFVKQSALNKMFGGAEATAQ
jgi:uncharacterized protein YdeI (YjbR/CyaY-like superfamily)